MSLVSLYIVPINRVYRFPRAAEMSEHRPGRSIKSARKKNPIDFDLFFLFLEQNFYAKLQKRDLTNCTFHR